MTYPPQGQYGQQPDPYGQQQPQQYGQQPAGQYGGYDPNAQYGGGYGQYSGLGGPQPPKSNKGAVIAVVSIVVLVLAGLGVTGFVAPGFLLSDDASNSSSGSGTTSGKPDDAAGADAFVKELVSAANGKNKDKLTDLQCSDASDDVKGATNSIDEIDSAKLKDTKKVSDTEVVATLNIVVNGDDGDYEATVVKNGKDWCWQDITSGSGGSSEPSTSEDDSTDTEAPTESTSAGPPATGTSEGEVFIQSFLDKLNAGDGAGAAAMSCPDSTSQSDITTAATQAPQLKIDLAGTTAEDEYVGADLVGTLNGEDASGRTSAFLEDAGWCIYTFFAF